MSLDISVATNHAARHWLIKGSMCASPTVVRLKSAALPSKGGGKLACLETLNHAGSGQWHSCSARGAVLSLLTCKECCLRGTRRIKLPLPAPTSHHLCGVVQQIFVPTDLARLIAQSWCARIDGERGAPKMAVEGCVRRLLTRALQHRIEPSGADTSHARPVSYR